MNAEDLETLFGKDFDAHEAFESIDRNHDEQVIFISDREIMFLKVLVCLSVCLSVCLLAM